MLADQIDVGQFWNYALSGRLSNRELDQVGYLLSKSEDAQMFCRNAVASLGHERGEYLSMALANSQPRKEGQ